MAEGQAVMSQRSECGGEEEFDSVMKLFILWPLKRTWLTYLCTSSRHSSLNCS